MYDLFIGRYGRYLCYNTAEELREEVSSYFSVGESSIIDHLCNFDHKPDADGNVRNVYQDFETSYTKEY